MFGLPIIAAALALAGAPKGLPVDCDEQLAARMNSAGMTWFGPGTTTPLRVDLGGEVCAGLVWLSASDRERRLLVALNPTVPFIRYSGVALVVVLHEAQHGTGDRNEAHAEACAMKRLTDFAGRFAPADEVLAILQAATAYDASMPATYKGATC